MEFTPLPLTNPEELLDDKLRNLTRNVVGIERDYNVPAGIRAIVEMTFNCDHDLRYVFVFPEEGEPFVREDYGYFPEEAYNSKNEPFEHQLTPSAIYGLAGENENYPCNIFGEEIATHEVGVRVVALVKAYLATI